MLWGIVGSVALFVVLAILTWTVEDFWRRTLGRLGRTRRQLRIRRDLVRNDAARMSARIAEVYRQRQSDASLFSATTVNDAPLLPLLVTSESLRSFELADSAEAWVTIGRHDRASFDVDDKLVRQVLASGRRLTDDAVLFADGIHELGSGRSRIVAGVTGYRSAITLASRVERTVKGATGMGAVPWTALATLPGALSAISGSLRPMVLGSDAVVAFQDGDRYLVPIHRRSAETINAPGAHTVTPAYTYESNRVGQFSSRFGVVTYNFLREYLEEFWGDENLVVASSAPRAHPDWILDSEQGRRLVDEVDSGRVTFHALGVAVDVSSCCLSLPLVAVFDSPEFLRYTMNAPGCWESARASGGRPAIEFFDLFGSEVDDMLRGTAKPTSALALDCARQLLS